MLLVYLVNFTSYLFQCNDIIIIIIFIISFMCEPQQMWNGF